MATSVRLKHVQSHLAYHRFARPIPICGLASPIQYQAGTSHISTSYHGSTRNAKMYYSQRDITFIKTEAEETPCCQKCGDSSVSHRTAYSFITKEFDEFPKCNIIYVALRSRCREEHGPAELEAAQKFAIERHSQRMSESKELKAMFDKVLSSSGLDQVPIAYCVNRFEAAEICVDANSNQRHTRLWKQRKIIESLGTQLAIVKVNNRYRWSMSRTDAMDFKLWYDSMCTLPRGSVK